MLAVKSFYFMLPAYTANIFPVLSRGLLKSLSRPVDCGIRLRGKPLFGPHKTIRGVVVGVAAALITFQVQKSIYGIDFFRSISIVDYHSMYISYFLLPGLVLGCGALLGDMIESMFKRQFSINPGKSWIPFDQIDFIIGALLLISLIYIPSWKVIVMLLVLTPALHIATNHLAYYLKLKKEKW